MQKATFVPGAIATPNPITLPAPFANMRRVSTAQILRMPNAVVVPNHPAVDIQGGAPINAHAVHAHDLISQGLGGPVANALGLPAGLNVLNDAGGAALHTVPGAGATGVQNNPAVQAHVFGAGAPVAHGANTGATPIVAAVPTLLTSRTFSLSVSTVLGDIVELSLIHI